MFLNLSKDVRNLPTTSFRVIVAGLINLFPLKTVAYFPPAVDFSLRVTSGGDYFGPDAKLTVRLIHSLYPVDDSTEERHRIDVEFDTVSKLYKGEVIEKTFKGGPLALSTGACMKSMSAWSIDRLQIKWETTSDHAPPVARVELSNVDKKYRQKDKRIFVSLESSEKPAAAAFIEMKLDESIKNE
jgi:hypothetical protein